MYFPSQLPSYLPSFVRLLCRLHLFVNSGKVPEIADVPSLDSLISIGFSPPPPICSKWLRKCVSLWVQYRKHFSAFFETPIGTGTLIFAFCFRYCNIGNRFHQTCSKMAPKVRVLMGCNIGNTFHFFQNPYGYRDQICFRYCTLLEVL